MRRQRQRLARRLLWRSGGGSTDRFKVRNKFTSFSELRRERRLPSRTIETSIDPNQAALVEVALWKTILTVPFFTFLRYVGRSTTPLVTYPFPMPILSIAEQYS